MGYSDKNEEILERAYEYVESVPYKVSLRWLFYRLFQEGFYTKKNDYIKWKRICARARREQYMDWHPSTLTDGTRQRIVRGGGHESPNAWLDAVSEMKCTLDKWTNQKLYIELWFEARAMVGQFEHYTKNITLVPMAGNPSISHEWEISQALDSAERWYGLPIKILYFGDHDEKGYEIPRLTEKHIRAWCDVDFEIIRCGLTQAQVGKYNLPANPEKPGYQWEALTDEQAKEIIEEYVGHYLDPLAIEKIRLLENEAEQELKEIFENRN